MKSVIKKDINDYKSVKYKKLYDFEDNSCDESDNQSLNEYSRNEFKLKNRQHLKTRNENQSLIEYINYEIKPNETLLAIALRYGCSVAAIKRINHLITDHEFYGLRVIKLPVK